MDFRGRGGDGIRTRVYGFAGRCLAPRPLHRMWISKISPTRADDEIRTRDPHLGKVMRYHCATSAFEPTTEVGSSCCSPHPCDSVTVSDPDAQCQNGTTTRAGRTRGSPGFPGQNGV